MPYLACPPLPAAPNSRDDSEGHPIFGSGDGTLNRPDPIPAPNKSIHTLRPGFSPSAISFRPRFNRPLSSFFSSVVPQPVPHPSITCASVSPLPLSSGLPLPSLRANPEYHLPPPCVKAPPELWITPDCVPVCLWVCSDVNASLAHPDLTLRSPQRRHRCRRRLQPNTHYCLYFAHPTLLLLQPTTYLPHAQLARGT